MAIQIPEPCTEDWNKMTPTEQGAFCQKCALEVMDFTRKTPLEIKSMLSERFNSGARVCGHIRQSQLDVLNEEGFDWTNERERFQFVWIVSMLAIFGLTLFSCQTNVSREIVEKMHREGQEIVASDEPEGQDTLSESMAEHKETDSLSAPVDVLPWRDVEVMSGVIPWTPEVYPFDICTVISGDLVVVDGFIALTPEPEDDKGIVSSSLNGFNLLSPKAVNYQQEYQPAPQHGNSGPRSELIYDEDLDDFVAYITPVPLSAESRLIVEVFREIELYLSVENVTTQTILFSKSYSSGKAVLSIDLHLHKYPKDNYKILLESNHTRQTIQFSTL